MANEAIPDRTFWRDVRVQVTASVIGGVILLTIGAWKWSDLKTGAAAAYAGLTHPLTLNPLSILAIALLAGFAGANRRKKASVPAQLAVASTVPEAPPSLPAGQPEDTVFETDMSKYFADWKKIRHRLAEQDEYEKSVIGRRVNWRGYVQWFNEHSNSISLHINADRKYSDGATVTFPLSFREKVRAKNRDDLVRITGVITEVRGGDPVVDGETLELIL